MDEREACVCVGVCVCVFVHVCVRVFVSSACVLACICVYKLHMCWCAVTYTHHSIDLSMEFVIVTHLPTGDILLWVISSFYLFDQYI